MHNFVFKLLALLIAVLSAYVVYLLIDAILKQPVFNVSPLIGVAIIILLGIIFLCLRSLVKKDL